MTVSALLGITAVALTLGAGALAQPAPDGPGPAVGARVPDFQLSDQAGANRSLQSVMGPKGLMLVFFRSADW
jgi:hypothetical protein